MDNPHQLTQCTTIENTQCITSHASTEYANIMRHMIFNSLHTILHAMRHVFSTAAPGMTWHFPSICKVNL